MLGFVAGIITGGLAVFFYRDEINRYFQRQLPSVREKLADQLRTVEERTSEALGRARTNVSERLRTGEQWLRTGTAPAANGDKTAGHDIP